MNCETFTSLMGDYRDNDLDADARAIFDGHRSICTDCTALFKSYNEINRVARSLSCDDMPAAVFSRMRKNLRQKLGESAQYNS
jgi:hypothetical protein